MVLAYEAVTITRVDQLFVAALDQFFVAGIIRPRMSVGGKNVATRTCSGEPDFDHWLLLLVYRNRFPGHKFVVTRPPDSTRLFVPLPV